MDNKLSIDFKNKLDWQSMPIIIVNQFIFHEKKETRKLQVKQTRMDVFQFVEFTWTISISMCRYRRRKLRCVYSWVIKTTASISPLSAADRSDSFTFEETSISFSRVQRNLRSQLIYKSIYARLHEQYMW